MPKQASTGPMGETMKSGSLVFLKGIFLKFSHAVESAIMCFCALKHIELISLIH